MSRVSWTNPIEHVQPGEPVSANVAARPSRQIADRLNAVRRRLVDQQGRLVLYDQFVDASIQVGEAVYLDNESRTFKGALAVTQVVNGRILPAASAEVEGIVVRKVSGTLADILVSGLATELKPKDEDGAAAPAGGVYYLSSTRAGRLTTTAPTMPIRVARYVSGIGTIVSVDRPSSFDQHRHYEHTLEGRAAAVEEVYIEDGMLRVRMTSANSALPGWLPASDPIFDGNAPPGAFFGYNLSQDDALRVNWPPAPIDAASLTVFSDTQDGFGREMPKDLIVFDKNGIWLKTNQLSQMPWEVLASLAGPSSSAAGSFGDGIGMQKKAVLHFLKSRYAADRTAVTTLQPAAESGPIRVVDCNGNNANSGDLFLLYDPDDEVETNEDLSPIGVKVFNRGGTIRRGPLAVGLIAGDDTIILESPNSQPVNENAPLGPRLFYGPVTIRAAIEASERLLPPQIVHLNGVQQRYTDDLLLGIAIKENTAATFKFVLPGPVGFPANSRASLRLWLVGGAATAVPDLTITTRRCPRATTPTALPVTDVNLTFVSPGIVPVDNYIEVDTTDSIAVEAADVVTVRVGREADDGYDGELQLINVWLRLFREE